MKLFESSQDQHHIAHHFGYSATGRGQLLNGKPYTQYHDAERNRLQFIYQPNHTWSWRHNNSQGNHVMSGEHTSTLMSHLNQYHGVREELIVEGTAMYQDAYKGNIPVKLVKKSGDKHRWMDSSGMCVDGLKTGMTRERMISHAKSHKKFSDVKEA